MELVNAADLSVEEKKHIYEQFFAIRGMDCLNYFIKSKSLFLIKNDEKYVLFYSIKPDNTTIYIPFYLYRVLDNDELKYWIIELNKQISEYQYKYISFFNRDSQISCFEQLSQYSTYEDASLKYIKTDNHSPYCTQSLNLRWVSDYDNKEKVKEMLNLSFAYEKEYVVGNWTKLTDYYFDEDSQKTAIYAFDEDKLVGCVLGSMSLKDPYIYAIATHPEYQGRGIGDQLMRRYLNHYIGSDIRLEVFQENLSAIRLYEKYNFKLIGQTSLVIRQFKTII